MITMVYALMFMGTQDDMVRALLSKSNHTRIAREDVPGITKPTYANKSPWRALHDNALCVLIGTWALSLLDKC